MQDKNFTPDAAFIVLYTDKYQHESCEDCNCGWSHEIKGVYSSFQKASDAIDEYIKINDAYSSEDFTIKEIVIDRRLN